MGVGAARGLKGAAQRLGEKPFVVGWLPSTKRLQSLHNFREYGSPMGKLLWAS